MRITNNLNSASGPNGFAPADQTVALLAVAAGVLACFWGYRILRVALGLTGFVVGAVGGWELGIALAPAQAAVHFAAAIVVGIIGAVLCIWLFLVGIFLLGASAGGIIGAAASSAGGHPPQILWMAIGALMFGVAALVARRFMIIVSTAFGGSYLIVSGMLRFSTHTQNAFPIFFAPSPHHPASAAELVPLLSWLVVGLAGIAFQFKSSGKKRRGSD
jgi:Domain of unknown function (DUF4203)